MARYTEFFGCRVEARYRAGDVSLTATGRLVADSGKSIFLEESFCQQGCMKTLRWEIPYQYITQLTAAPQTLPVREPLTSTKNSSPVPVRAGFRR